MKRGAFALVVMGVLVMSAEGDDKKEDPKDEPKVIKVGVKEYNEMVTIQVLFTGSGEAKGKLLKPQEVWAFREEIQAKFGKPAFTRFHLWGVKGSTAQKRLPFKGNEGVGEGTIITDAEGNVFTSTSGGSDEVRTTLTKAAKKEDKK